MQPGDVEVRLSLTEFCDSQFIQSGDYADTLARLQEIFYLYKNESMDELTDRELLEIMKENFEQICYGDLEYLETTCLERFAAAVRAGYETEFQKKERDEYTLRKSGNEDKIGRVRIEKPVDKSVTSY